MTRVTSDTMTIIINGVDYSTYVDSVSISGGGPKYELIKVWNGHKKRAVTGYEDINIELSLLMDDTILSFINGFNDNTNVYTIILGELGVIERTYNTMYVDTFNDDIAADKGLQIITVTFVGEGHPDNKN